jgi:hypothetical protein
MDEGEGLDKIIKQTQEFCPCKSKYEALHEYREAMNRPKKVHPPIQNGTKRRSKRR